MGSRWASGLAVAALAAAPPLAGQEVRELGIQATLTASDPVLGVAGLYGALRPSQRTRISAAAGAGGSDGEAAWRGELLLHFLLNPAAQGRPGAYLAGGIAAVGGPVERGYLVVTLGFEANPGSASGWFVEAGVGGGARLAGGYRWRWFPPWWPLRQ
ncbi:MAG: hypothetical protein ACREMX_16635 [Gemmatimonadales bacterium]